MSEVYWTERITSTSNVLDPLGIQYHIKAQKYLVPGITSVTKRARYYTLWSWYIEYLAEEKQVSHQEFERLFILSCLASIDGKKERFGELRSIHNYTQPNWDNENEFKIDKSFKISGQGWTFYNKQLEVFKCYQPGTVTTFRTTKLNKKLSKTLTGIDVEKIKEISKRKIVTKSELKHSFQPLSVVALQSNASEVDILSKILFGFISQQGADWDLDESAYNKFLKGDLDLGIPSSPVCFENETVVYNKFRANSLFLFLKIIHEVHPHVGQTMIEDVWPVLYYGINPHTNKRMELGTLQEIRKHWEYVIFNTYYIYAIEAILWEIQEYLKTKPGSSKEEILSEEVLQLITKEISKGLKIPISKKTRGHQINKTDISIREQDLFLDLETHLNITDSFAKIYLMLLNLKNHWEEFDSILKEVYRKDVLPNRLDIELIFNSLDSSTIKDFFAKLLENVIIQHKQVTAEKWAAGTKSWIFVEDEYGRLYPSRMKEWPLRSRENRINSILSILKDLQFITIDNEYKLKLTEKGKKWLKLAQLI